MTHFHREFLRILRGLADGSYDGWIPRVEDLYRLQLETTIYVDKDGIVSSTGRDEKPSSWAGAKTTDPRVQITVPPTGQDVEQLNTGRSVTSGIGVVRQDGFSPIEFLANSTSFFFGTPVSSLAKEDASGQPFGLDGNGMSSLLPMDLMVYNEFMTDIGGSMGFFDEDFRNSVLFGSPPIPSLAMKDTGSV